MNCSIYSDDSSFPTLAAASAIIVTPDQESKIKAILDDLRKEYSIPNNLKIHCRKFFSGHQREKIGLGHLNSRDVMAFYSKLGAQVAPLIVPIFSYAYKQDFPAFIPAKFVDGHNWPKFIINEKTLIAFCAYGSLIPAMQEIEKDKIKIWADPDPTRFPWLGQNRQMKSAISGYVDRSPNPGSVQISLEPDVQNKQDMISVADFVAYFGASALSLDFSNDQHEKFNIFHAMNSHLIKLFIRPDTGGFTFEVPEHLRVKLREIEKSI